MYTSAELYGAFSQMDPEQISRMLEAIRASKWHFMSMEDRLSFLSENLPEELFQSYGELLSNFRCGGYRILGDLLCDIQAENTSEGRQVLFRPDDSPLMMQMLQTYQKKLSTECYREAVSKGCRKYLDKVMKSEIALQCAAALNKRNFIWEVLLDQVAKYARKEAGR